MDVEFDPEKSARNERERGLPFDLAAELAWDRALIAVDDRKDYGEERFVALAPMAGRLYVVCYTFRPAPRPDRVPSVGQVRRIISFRKANEREEQIYEQATTD
jgi:uncharacterized DUF497 family protein